MTMNARALNTRLLVAAATALTAAATPPACASDNIGITSGIIKTTTLRIDKGLNAPKVELRLTGDVLTTYFTWAGPSGKIISQTFYVTTSPGATTFKGYSNIEGFPGYQYGPSTTSFGPFTASGTWTLTNITICGRNAGCIDYSGAALAALFPSLSVAVTNPLSDVTPPVFVSGWLQDTQIRASQPLHLKTTVADDVSGAVSLYLAFSVAGSGRTSTYANVYFTSPITSQETMKMQISISFSRLPAGTYVISEIDVADRAGNKTTIRDASTISSLFGGNASFIVTKS